MIWFDLRLSFEWLQNTRLFKDLLFFWIYIILTHFMIKNYFHISKAINLINVNVFQLNFLNQTLSQYKRSFFLFHLRKWLLSQKLFFKTFKNFKNTAFEWELQIQNSFVVISNSQKLMKKQSIKHLMIKYEMKSYSKSQKHLIQHYFESLMRKSLTKDLFYIV
jgi:hypothetical protein